MEVILLERVEKLGRMGEVVSVKPGFARNYLLPQKKALRASKDNLAFFESQKAKLEAQNAERKVDAEKLAQKIADLSVVIIRQSGETGILYGSVSARDVAEAVTATGTVVERSQVAIETPIKTLGLFKVRLVLHPEVSVAITVNVARTTEEAGLQAARGGMVAGRRDEDEEEEAVEAADEATEDTEA
ncbi:50S ribosomal protein L9 [Nitrospirillum iridis]|uniref:Large ribosomal subunit protein bL9 n=1 Tax=Nitrospirillum iridis TaxID=765888 RepID=A0A7X0EDS4_9PROT|nr:50S ribosomal protein L9 [Nitrospirillum iridis]MBB6251311.1 large subunit ribosomal protein L9 [Nitrospirillum iridis]